MIELYNEDNIKVYADSTAYSVRALSREFRLIDKNGYIILRLPNRKTQGLTITIKGDTLTLEGRMSYCFIINYRYNITLKGEVEARVKQEDKGPNVYTHNLYGSSKILTDANGLTKHNYFLHDSAYLQISGTDSVYLQISGIGSADTCEIFAYDDSMVATNIGCTITIYDNAEVRTSTPDAEIYAYDNSKVVSDYDENIHLFDNAKLYNY